MRSAVLMSLFFVIAASSPIHGKRGITHEEWVEMVQETVEELRTSRSLPDVHIEDLSDYYRQAFEQLNDEVSIQVMYGNRQYSSEKILPERYIVFLQNDVSDDRLDHIVNVLQKAQKDSNQAFVADHIKPFRHIGKGFTATLGARVVKIMEKHPQKYLIENDRVIKRNNHDDLSFMEETLGELQDTSSLEWNLDRIDQRKKELDHKYSPKGNGHRVHVYILDTGIRYSHSEFKGRAKYAGYDAIDQLVKSNKKMKGLDCNGHGTHCAGTIGGHQYGVAKQATLYSARVLDCSGTGSVQGILDAMEFIIKKRKDENHQTKAVFSMSLGVTKITTFNEAINNVVKKGIVVVAASGNQGSNSCNYSPGSAALSLSVAATSSDDVSATFSNIGKCTDIFAPGLNIKSAGHECDTCTAIKSGTSMACPHVAGYVAVILSLDSSLTPQQVKEKMIKDSTKGVVNLSLMANDLKITTANRFLYVGK